MKSNSQFPNRENLKLIHPPFQVRTFGFSAAILAGLFFQISMASASLAQQRDLASALSCSILFGENRMEKSTEGIGTTVEQELARPVTGVRDPNRLGTYRGNIANLRLEIDKETSTAQLDQLLLQFVRFHRGETQYEMRPWEKVGLKGIKPEDIEGMPQETWNALISSAMEVEAPTHFYQMASGESFSQLLPSVGRFMGINKAQRLFIEEVTGFDGKSIKESKKFCKAAWCEEENRHANWLFQMAKFASGRELERNNPNDTVEHSSSEKEAIKHLAGRGSNELSAAGVYFTAINHAKEGSVLRHAFEQILRDEIKHLVTMTGGYYYIHGPRPVKRAYDHIKNTVEALLYQSKSRSESHALLKDKPVLAEYGAAHVLLETRVRDYMKTVPLRVLRKIFEVDSQLPPLGEKFPSEGARAEHERKKQEYEDRRQSLYYWKAVDKHAESYKEGYEAIHRSGFEQVVTREFNGFKGAENPDSSYSKKLAQQIQQGKYTSDDILRDQSTGKGRLVKEILYERLREYQFEAQLAQP